MQLHRLSSAFVKSAPQGKHSDGQGLWLIKRPDGGAQWMLRISLGGKRREMGLGSANDVSLKEAFVKKDFERQSQNLQQNGFINCFEDKVWIVHDEDRQDI